MTALNRIQIGDCRTILPTLPAGMFKCCVTSPPYWGLRDYGVEGQLGLEATPEEYVANMVAVFREVRRCLAADGTLWLNLGDSYVTAPHGSGSTHDPKWPAGRDRAADRANRSRGHRAQRLANTNAGNTRRPKLDEYSEDLGRIHGAGLKPKDMVGIPWRVAFALQADGWYLRSDIIWAKPNPMPESVADRPTKSHEYLFLLTKSPRYHYDADAIRSPLQPKTMTTLGTERLSKGTDALGRVKSANLARDIPERRPRLDEDGGLAGANARTVWFFAQRLNLRRVRRRAASVWTLPTKPYAGAHFATFPTALVTPCILAGSSFGDAVLDPFMGSGTVGQVAERLGRRWFGCELSPKYGELAAERTAQTGLPFKAEPSR